MKQEKNVKALPKLYHVYTQDQLLSNKCNKSNFINLITL